jgi:hypothetical protein
LSESYIKAEIVRPKWTAEEWVTKILSAILNLALITLVLFWFVATWFPQLGLTYWQLILPVYTIRSLIAPPRIGRQLK